ncbi:MAG: cyclic nucleotide-binding domain-containing protein [Deltaproteobacteria bacterium]|nr:cyclic nucleotide-binding domain-containing protein [Deltaproteobacteria bacterium]
MKDTGFLQDNISVIESLKKLPIISSLEDRHIKGLVKLCKIIEYAPGERIFAEDGFDQHLYILISGKVSVLKNGVEVSALTKPGDIFGEMGIIDAAARSASVFAVDKVSCLKMDASFMDRLKGEEKQTVVCVVNKVFTEMLSDRLRKTTEEFIKAKEELERLKKRG